MGNTLKELEIEKRALESLESEIELLRSHMESGRIHIRVSTNKQFRQELAEKIVKISHPAYSKQYHGWYVCDPIKGKIYYYSSRSSYSQYSEEDAYRIVDIEDCFDDSSSFALNIDWYERIREMSDNYQLMVSEYLKENELEESDLDTEEFVQWVKEQPKYSSLIQEIEESEEEEAVSFAYGEIKNEVIVEI